jgi:hypothetical protein
VGEERERETHTPVQDLGFGGTRGSAAPSVYLSGLTPDEHAVDRAVDMDTNLLHTAAGRLCERCGRVITDGQPVRRTVSGGYQHDVC